MGAAGAGVASALPQSLFAQSSDIEMALKATRSLPQFPQRNLTGLIPDGSQDNLKPVVEQWKKATGQNVDLTVVSVDDINTRMIIDALTGELGYDFALPATFGIPDLVHANVLQSFGSIQKTLGLKPSATNSIYSIGDRIGGERYGYQTDGDVYLMFYRTDIVDDPSQIDAYQSHFGQVWKTPDSWSVLDQQMEFFDNPTQGQYGGALFRIPGYLAWEFIARLLAQGVHVFDENLEPQLETDAAEQVLEDMRRAGDFLHPAVFSLGLFENWNLFKTENIYANIGWGGSQKAFNHPDSLIRGKLSHAALPGLADLEQSYFNWGWSYVVPTTAAQPQAAYLFSRFAVSEAISILSVREKDGYFDPFQEIHYKDEKIIEAYSKSFLDVHQSAMRNAGHNLNIPGHGSYMASLNENLTLALDGSLTVKRALQLIAAEWRLITVEIGLEEQIKRYREISTKG